MPANASDSWADRRRANEDEYFRKRDQELVEKARLRSEDEAALQRLAEAAGVRDEDVLRDLQRLGYTEETVTLLHVVPLIDVAWADGRVSEPERNVIIAAARARGVEPGSHADRQVARLLADPPSSLLSDGTLHVLGAMMQRHGPDARAAAIRTLLSSCTAVASASGGIFGFRPISDKEQRALDRILCELERKDAPLLPR
jgi:hypothetical protein